MDVQLYLRSIPLSISESEVDTTTIIVFLFVNLCITLIPLHCLVKTILMVNSVSRIPDEYVPNMFLMFMANSASRRRGFEAGGFNIAYIKIVVLLLFKCVFLLLLFGFSFSFYVDFLRYACWLLFGLCYMWFSCYLKVSFSCLALERSSCRTWNAIPVPRILFFFYFFQ